MKKDTDKTTLLKRAGAVIAIAAGLIAGGAALSHKNDKDVPTKPKKEYVKKNKSMTTEQKMKALETAERVLQELQQTIDAKNTNAEERFEARRAYKEISAERDSLLKQLGMER